MFDLRLDVSGRTQTTFGKIGRCIVSFDDSKEPFYDIQYNEMDNSVQGSNLTLFIDNVSEKIAWGGHMAYLAEIEPHKLRSISLPIPFYVKWVFPDYRYIDSSGNLELQIRGYQLKISEEKSTIPGAGLGLILRVFDFSGCNRSHFVLPKGEVLALGLYGPLFPDDKKSTHVFEVKSFIHDYEPESYCFETVGGFVDITDDRDGQLHDLAKSRLMCRINETDGKELPHIWADRDPTGAIQYYIGHGTYDEIDMQIPVGCPFELKVCYITTVAYFKTIFFFLMNDFLTFSFSD